MTVPPGAPDEVPAGAPTRPGTVPTIAAGCAGFFAFYIGGMAVAIGSARGGGIGVGFVLALIVVVAATAYRNTTAGGRALLARMAIGIGVAALVFGGCLALVTGGKIRIGG